MPWAPFSSSSRAYAACARGLPVTDRSIVFSVSRMSRSRSFSLWTPLHQLSRHSTDVVRRHLEGVPLDLQHIADLVHQQAHHPVLGSHHHVQRRAASRARGQLQSSSHVDGGHDLSSKVDQPLDHIRRQRQRASPPDTGAPPAHAGPPHRRTGRPRRMWSTVGYPPPTPLRVHRSGPPLSTFALIAAPPAAASSF